VEGSHENDDLLDDGGACGLDIGQSDNDHGLCNGDSGSDTVEARREGSADAEERRDSIRVAADGRGVVEGVHSSEAICVDKASSSPSSISWKI